MGYLSRICGLINDQLIATSFKDSKFAGARYDTLATIIPYEDEDKLRFRLVSLEPDGSVISDDLMVDDSYPINLFHIAKDSVWLERKTDEYGDEVANYRVTNMSMIIFARRKQIKLDADDLELLVKFGLRNGSFEVPNYGTVDAIIQQCDFNQRLILAEEFGLESYTLEPESVLIRLKYKLECSVSGACVKIICC